ncbi:hypothetical protein [Luteimonas sp. MHLX1A]|uniref:hypothetical protein n=1 Tax=Alterluteimonas muca TaxID=2878684 RepID=UPI001E2D8F7D|nr:hypothetical protein [Luteimonas sp. MHLX1A]MCD9046849.1 hypothetical protein [Luteimonas sp. MHLX1A]
MIGGSLGPVCPTSVRRDIVALNQKWISRESDLARDINLASPSPYVVEELSPRVIGDRRIALGVARAGAVLFRPVDEDRVGAAIHAVLEDDDADSLHVPLSPANGAANFATQYFQSLREVSRQDPVLAGLIFRVKPSTLRVRNLSLAQIAKLTHTHDIQFRPIQADALSSLMQAGRMKSLRPEQQATLRGWTLLADETPELPAIERIAEPALASNRISQLYNILLLGSVGCRPRLIHTLTHARRVEIQTTMQQAGYDTSDPGGRRYSRTASLIETPRAHVISSLFLRNYIRARALYGVPEESSVISPDAFARAMLASMAADVVDNIDPYLAHMTVRLYHEQEVSMRRCTSCRSHYLCCDNPVEVRGEVVTGDCPVCREIESIRTGSPVFRLSGRRSRLSEVVAGFGT